jgi:fructokinase
VRIANDADCFALSEASDGAGAGSWRRLRRDPRHRRRRRRSSSTGASGSGRTRSPASGATTSCRRGPKPACPRRPAIAAGGDCIETYISGPGLARGSRPARAGGAPAPDARRVADWRAPATPAAQAALSRCAAAWRARWPS